jgi:hypothetical protein
VGDCRFGCSASNRISARKKLPKETDGARLKIKDLDKVKDDEPEVRDHEAQDSDFERLGSGLDAHRTEGRKSRKALKASGPDARALRNQHTHNYPIGC